MRGYLANAEKVRVRGIEADFSARPSERLRLYASGAFTDHEYVRFVYAPCPPELAGVTAATAANPPSPPATPGGFSSANCNVSGQWLPGNSRWAASYGAEYNVPIDWPEGEAQAYVGVDGSYRSSFSLAGEVQAVHVTVDLAIRNEPESANRVLALMDQQRDRGGKNERCAR